MIAGAIADEDLPEPAGSATQVCFWPRVVLHVVLTDFFVSVERRDDAGLCARPVIVADDLAGVVVAASREARDLGARVGMRAEAARALGAGIASRAARPRACAATSARIFQVLATVSSDVEEAGIGEFVLDGTHAQRAHGSPEHMARLVRRLVTRAGGGIACTVGVGPNRFAARVAAAEAGPIGVIAPWEVAERLRDVPIDALTAQAPHVAGFLRRRGARTCADVARLPAEEFERAYGNLGRQLWLAAQGREPEAVSVDVVPPKSLGHGKVLPPRTTSRRVIEAYLRHLCGKLATRMRREGWCASRLYVGLRFGVDDGAAETFPLDSGVPDGGRFTEYARRLLREHWRGETVTHVQVTASRLHRAGGQLDLFALRAPAAGVAAFRQVAADAGS